MPRRRGNGRLTGNQAPRRALATQAARRSAPASGGVKRARSRDMIVTSTVTLPKFMPNFGTMDKTRQVLLQRKWDEGLSQVQRDIASAIFLYTRDDEVQHFLEECNIYLNEGTDDSWNKFISVLNRMDFTIHHAQDPKGSGDFKDDGQVMPREEGTAALKSTNTDNSISMEGTCSQSPSPSPTAKRLISDYFDDTQPGSASASTKKRFESKEGPGETRSPSTNTNSRCTESLPASDSTENKRKPQRKPQEAKSPNKNNNSGTSIIKKRLTPEKKPRKKQSGSASARPSKPISDPTKKFVSKFAAIMAISKDKAMADKVMAERFAYAVLQGADVTPAKCQGIVTFYRKLTRGGSSEIEEFRNRIQQHYQIFVHGDDVEKKIQVDHVVAAIKEGCRVA